MVNAGVVLTIASGTILEINLKTNKLLVKQGGGVLVKKGGTLRQTTTQQFNNVTIQQLIFHHADHLSGSNIETDANGAVIEVLDYFPFGSVRLDEKAGGYADKYKYTGKELDGATGLYYYGARYYNGSIGRFVGLDPVAMETPETFLNDPQQLNSYSYTRNNPLRFVDPDGRELETPYDIGNVFYDIGAIAKNAGEILYSAVQTGVGIYKNDTSLTSRGVSGLVSNVKDQKNAATDLGADIVSTAIPFAPAGATKMIRAADKAGDAGKALKGSQNPVVKEAIKEGQVQHKLYKAKEVSSTLIKEFRFKNGLKADAVDFKNKIVYELKPENNRAIQRGINQVKKYVQQAQNEFGGVFKGIVDTYKRKIK